MRALIAAIALTIVACTSNADVPSPTEPGPTPTTVPPTTTTTTDTLDAVGAFHTCLAENGIEIEEVPIDASGRPRFDLVTRDLDLDDPATAEAMAVCSLGLGTGALDSSDDELMSDLVLDQLRAFSQCVRDRGISDFPDPEPTFSGIGSPYSIAEIPYSNPALAEVLASCRQTALSGLPG